MVVAWGKVEEIKEPPIGSVRIPFGSRLTPWCLLAGKNLPAIG